MLQVRFCADNQDYGRNVALGSLLAELIGRHVNGEYVLPLAARVNEFTETSPATSRVTRSFPCQMQATTPLGAGQTNCHVVDVRFVSEQPITGYQNFEVPAVGTLIAVGNFDGVHLGHRALMQHILAQAESRSLIPVVMTFDPHPAAVLTAAAPVLLTSTERKIALIREVAPQLNIIVQPFDADFSRIEAEEFVERILLRSLNARSILVGKNFHFGRARRGTPDLLRTLSDKWGFVAEAYDLSGDIAGTFSSSRARTELVAGNLEDVAHVLGRPHAITGLVVSGDGRGKGLGFPTANLAEIEEGLPPEGVYTCIVCEVTPAQPHRRLGLGVMSLGPRPTVNSGFAVEVHVLDFADDLYSKRLRVHIVHRLRGIERFADVGVLLTQIAADIGQARLYLKQWLRANREPSV